MLITRPRTDRIRVYNAVALFMLIIDYVEFHTLRHTYLLCLGYNRYQVYGGPKISDWHMNLKNMCICHFSVWVVCICKVVHILQIC